VLVWLRRTAITIAVLLVITLAAFFLSPWPSVLVLRTLGDDGLGGAEANEKLVPDGISSQLDVQIGYGDDDRIDVFRPEAADHPLPAVVWVHGGGFIGGVKEPLRPYLKILASHGYVTVNVEYSKAPENRYPKAVEQVDHALGYVVDHADELGLDPKRIVLGGDSAGAHIAAQTAIATTDREYAEHAGLPQSISSSKLRGMILFSGPFDLDMVGSGSFLERWYIRTVMWSYTGERGFADDASTQWLSLVDHVSSQTPPAFISTGPNDPLLAHSESMIAALKKAAVDTDALLFDAKTTPDSVGHEYQLALATPQAQEALDRVVAFLAEVTS